MNKKNILLLAMSAFPKTISESKYNTAFDDFVCQGYSQLEPIAQYMIAKLGHIDEMVMMCTKTTVEDKKTIAGKEIVAVDFFMERMSQFIGTYPTQYTVVEISENEPEKGIAKTVGVIRSLMKENENGTFWVDTHGGLRDIAMVNTAIVSLLKVDDIMPDKIYGIEFNPNHEGKIVEQNQSFRIFDFVSGMNDFINYGNASMLQKYYQNENVIEIQDVLHAMDMVSEGTQVCDSKLYLQGLNALGESIKKVKENDTLFSIFAEYIKADYGDLLDEKKRTVLDVIKRCVAKQLYQQALTLIESLMPEEYVQKKFIYYEESSQNNNTILKAKQKHNKSYLSNAHFVFDAYVFKQYYFPRNVKQNGLIDAVECFALGQMKNMNSSFICREREFKFEAIRGNEVIGMIHVYTNVKKENWKKAGQLVRMHKALKTCRNALNHSNPNRPEMSKIIMMMQRYCNMANEILRDM